MAIYRYYTHSDELKRKERKSFFFLFHFTSSKLLLSCGAKDVTKKMRKSNRCNLFCVYQWDQYFFDGSSTFDDKIPSFIYNTYTQNHFNIYVMEVKEKFAFPYFYSFFFVNIISYTRTKYPQRHDRTRQLVSKFVKTKKFHNRHTRILFLKNILNDNESSFDELWSDLKVNHPRFQASLNRKSH